MVVVTGLAAQFGRLERKTSAAQQLGHAFLPTCFLALFAVAFVLVVGRFRIGRDHTFVVAEYHAVRSLRDDIVRHDRNLATTARSVHDECRNGVTRGVSPEVLDDFDAFRYRSAEVCPMPSDRSQI